MTRLWNSPHFTLIMAMLMWAGHTIVARLSVGEMSPMVMMGLRWFACLAILAFIFRRQIGAEWPRVRERLVWVMLMGGGGMAGFTFFFILAAHHTTAVNLGITQSSVPAIVMILSLAVFGTQIGMMQLVGLAVSFLGVAVLFLASPEQRTIPRQMWSGIREQISPTILAVATLLVLLSIILLTVIELLRRRSERLRGVTPS